MKYIFFILILFSFSKPNHAQVNITLEIHQPPELMINAGNDTTVDVGTNIILGGNPTAIGGKGFYDYTWSPMTFLNNPYGSNPEVENIIQEMTYILTVTDQNCEKRDTISVYLSGTTDLEDTFKEFTIKVYPIPTNKHLNIDIGNQDYNDLSVELFDISGKMLHQSQIKNNITVLRMEDYIPGSYFLKMTNGRFEKTFSIIKN